MIKLQHMNPESETFIIRFYEGDNPGPLDPYMAICTVNKENNNTVWIHGFMGEVGRKELRMLVSLLKDMGIMTIKAYRAEGRKLPKARPVGDHYEILVQDFF